MQASVKTKIEKWLLEKLLEDDLFIVDIKLVANRVQIFIDGMINVSIDKCAEISKFIGDKLDTEPSVPENYILEVSSPGMSNPLKVPQQYKKRLGKELDILMNDGTKIAGILKEQIDGGIYISLNPKEIKESKKKNKEIEQIESELKYIAIENIKKAIVKFNFK